MPSFRVSWVVLIAVCFGGAFSGAATLEVGSGAPYATIQSAITAATPGVDDVFVRCGVYNENILMKSGVGVVGAGPPCAIIDGSGIGSVVRVLDSGATTLLEGFTLRNGSAAQGGGIFIEASAVVIRNNVIESNSAVGALFPDGVGGGIHIQTDFSRAFTEPLISGNVIRNNTAERFGGGISVDTDDGSMIVNNIIVGNSAGQAGGGIDIFSSFPDLVNNTIVRNCSQAGALKCLQGGGGVSVTNSGVVEFFNNVIAWNEAGVGGGGVDATGSTIDFRNNDAFGNIPVEYGGGDPTGAAGNISVDPLFSNEEPSRSGFEPRSDSPLVDGGTATLTPALDSRGVPRAIDGDADGVDVPDIGARENEGATRLGFSSKSALSWDASVDPAATFNLYRGELPILKSIGMYTQDLVTAPDSNQWCDLAAPNLADTDVPPGGNTWFYLADIEASIEGTLGFDGNLTERPFTNPNQCP